MELTAHPFIKNMALGFARGVLPHMARGKSVPYRITNFSRQGAMLLFRVRPAMARQEVKFERHEQFHEYYYSQGRHRQKQVTDLMLDRFAAHIKGQILRGCYDNPLNGSWILYLLATSEFVPARFHHGFYHSGGFLVGITLDLREERDRQFRPREQKHLGEVITDQIARIAIRKFRFSLPHQDFTLAEEIRRDERTYYRDFRRTSEVVSRCNVFEICAFYPSLA